MADNAERLAEIREQVAAYGFTGDKGWASAITKNVPWLLSLLDARDARIADLEAELEAVKRSRVYEPCVLGPDGRCTRWAHNHEDGV